MAEQTRGETILQLFPETTSRDATGSMSIGGCELTDLATRFGTPTFVVDDVALRNQARRYRDGLASRRPGSRVAFASKAFPCRAVYRLMEEEGLLVDCAGGGELIMALDAGVSAEHVILHGNAKTDAELQLALEHQVGLIVIDGIAEIDRIDRLATRAVRVLLRVQPEVDPMTQAAISTGHRGSKFGIGVDQLPDAITTVRRSQFLDLAGVHLHLGSQMLTLEPWVEALRVVAKLGTFDTYDIGGGLGVRYTRDETAPSLSAYLDTISEAAGEHLPDAATLLIEPGRSLVAQSTATIYTTITIKSGTTTYVAVDGGIADNFEASLYYGQRFEATLAARPGGVQLVDVVGRHCESGDRIAPAVCLDSPQVGDVVAVPMTGAYTHTLVNNYNGALRPPVVFVRDGQAHAVVRRDTYDDLLARELPWPSFG